jgi:[acyl-carrier-protein] S-malonyltransferase
MGRDFFGEYPEVRDIFGYAPGGLDLGTLCFDADLAELSRTEHTQPAMGAFAAAVTRLLYGAGITPQYAAGLSLGEYGALHAAGVFGAETLLDLLAFRGRAMADASRGVDFGMSAVICDDASVTERAVAETAGGVWCCNYNCPGQIVIGGESAAVAEATKLALEYGARRALPLNVGGPFHTPFMNPAAVALSDFFAKLDFAEMKFPVVFNVTGGVLAPGGTVRGNLTEQVRSPVRFETCLRTLAASGVDTVIEIGPGKTLSGFVRKTAPEIKTYAIDGTEDFRAVVRDLKGG